MEQIEFISFRVPKALKHKVLTAYNKRQQLHLAKGGEYKKLNLQKFYNEFIQKMIDPYTNEVEKELEALL